MTVETAIVAVIAPLVGGRFYADAPPSGSVARPYGTYSQVGGRSLAFVEGGAAPSKKHGRFQVNLWADTRPAAAALAQDVDDAMRAATAFFAEPSGEPEARYEPLLKLHGTQQDFEVWSDR